MAKEEIFIDNSDIGATLQDTMNDIVGIVTKANLETETITPTETPQKKQNINELLTKKETKSCHKNILIKKSTADKIKALAHRNKTSENNIINTILEQFFENI